MSRDKNGLNYFNIETDIFVNRKIRRLVKNFGSKGFLIYMYILTEIYRDKGCFIEWDENTIFDVADYLNVSENLIKEVVMFCVGVGFFDKKLLDSEKVLTSKSIQKRWEFVAKNAKRKTCKVSQVRPEITLTREEMQKTREEMQKTREEMQKTREETTQSKVKESKEKEIKEKEKKESAFKKCAPKKEDLKEFENFLNYWFEKNEKGVKFKFEKEKTFNWQMRWRRWLLNAEKFSKEKSFAKKEKFNIKNIEI